VQSLQAAASRAEERCRHALRERAS